jgi:hypothetical protein
MADIRCPFCQRKFSKIESLLSHQKESQKCSVAIARGINDGSISMVDAERELVVDRNDAAAALGGAAIVGGLLAGAAALGVAAMMPKVVERYTLDVDKSVVEIGCARAEERIIEFERKLPFQGFKASHLFPNEPNFRYGDGNGIGLASKEDLLLPDGWKWADAWLVLKGSSANQSGTDSDGWMYAFNWGTEYAGSPSMTHCVRQRIWFRTCTAKFTQKEVESGVINLSLKPTTAETLLNGQEECMTNDQSDGNPDKGKLTATATLPNGAGSGNDIDLKELFERNGIADIFQRATEELGIKSASDLKFLEKDDLDTLRWLTPVAKRKILLLMTESHV